MPPATAGLPPKPSPLPLPSTSPQLSMPRKGKSRSQRRRRSLETGKPLFTSFPMSLRSTTTGTTKRGSTRYSLRTGAGNVPGSSLPFPAHSITPPSMPLGGQSFWGTPTGMSAYNPSPPITSSSVAPFVGNINVSPVFTGFPSIPGYGMSAPVPGTYFPTLGNVPNAGPTHAGAIVPSPKYDWVSVD